MLTTYTVHCTCMVLILVYNIIQGHFFIRIDSNLKILHECYLEVYRFILYVRFLIENRIKTIFKHDDII